MNGGSSLLDQEYIGLGRWEREQLARTHWEILKYPRDICVGSVIYQGVHESEARGVSH